MLIRCYFTLIPFYNEILTEHWHTRQPQGLKLLSSQTHHSLSPITSLNMCVYGLWEEKQITCKLHTERPAILHHVTVEPWIFRSLEKTTTSRDWRGWPTARSQRQPAIASHTSVSSMCQASKMFDTSVTESHMLQSALYVLHALAGAERERELLHLIRLPGSGSEAALKNNPLPQGCVTFIRGPHCPPRPTKLIAFPKSTLGERGLGEGVIVFTPGL